MKAAPSPTRLVSAHHRALERMYHAAPINRWFAPKLAIGDGVASVEIPVREEFHHAARAAHGSIVFKALDDAAFFAANSLVPESFVLTAAFNVHFLRPIAAGVLRAEGRVLHRTGSSFLAEAVARDSEGNEVARGTGSFVRSKVPLESLLGYEP